MKRAFKQKVESVPSGVADNEALSQSYSEENPPGGTAGSLRASSIEVRRTRTSAATIGLAISIGVSSLLLPGQGDEVVASPVTSEATTATVPAALERASVNSSSVKVEPEAAVVSSSKKLESEAKQTTMPPTVESQLLAASTTVVPPVIEHKVKPGQTLWQVSQKYQVDAAAIAASNENVPSTVLPPGKVLKIPSVNGIVREVKPGDTVETVSQSYGISPTQLKLSSGTTASGSLPVGELITVPGNTNNLLKARQDNALSNLKEQRDRLQVSLAELGSEESKTTTEQIEVQGSSAIAEGSKTAVVPPAVEAEVPIVTAPQQLVTVPSPEMKSGSSPVTPMTPGWVVAPKVATTPTPASMKSPSPVTPTAPGLVVVPKAVTIPTSEVVAPKTSSSASNKLEVPTSAIVEPQVPQTGNLYEVKPGDTLDAIAQSHGVSRSELLRVNHIDNPNVIHISQKLIIPSPTPSLPLSSSINPTSNFKAQELPRAIVATPSLTIPNLSTAAVLPATPKESVLSSKIAATNVTVASPVVGTRVPTSTVLIAKEVPQSLKSNSDSDSNPYVGKLRDEIIKLREQYRTQREGSPANKPVANIAVPTVKLSVPAPNNLPTSPPSQYINPEFSPKQYNEALQRENQKLPQKQTLQQGPIQIKVPAPDSPGKGTRQPLVATSAVGADVYNPTMQTPIGRPVSPELPSINAPDDFLPNNTRPFQGYIWPTKGVLTSGYGWRWGRMHRGVDIAAPVGTPVMAAAPGVVVYSRWNAGGYGNLVDIQHADGTLTRYGHNNKLLVREGQQVDQGQQIAEMGSTGYSTGPHCHFEVHPQGKGAVNPIAYLPKR